MGSNCSCDTSPGLDAPVESGNDEELQQLHHTKNFIEVAQDIAAATVAVAEKVGHAVVDGTIAVTEAVEEGATDIKKEVLEKVEDIGGAVTGIAGVVVVELSVKGVVQKKNFLAREAGMELGLSAASCCGGSTAQSEVIVKKVVPGGQAEKLGIVRGAVVKFIAGNEILGLQQAQKLLAAELGRLPDSKELADAVSGAPAPETAPPPAPGAATGGAPADLVIVSPSPDAPGATATAP